METVMKSIPISKLNRGYAGKIFDEIQNENSATVVIRNNEPVAVIISVDLYNEMAVNYFKNPINSLKRKHNSAGLLSKYAKKELVGKEEEIYHKELDRKYGKK